MVIVTKKAEIYSIVENFKFTTEFMDENCKNSKFISIQKINSEIVGIAFVGGMMNSYGIEISEKFQGRKLSSKLFEEVISECKKRNISFLTGVYKSTNIISFKIHSKFGFVPVFSVFYNEQEGREIVVIFPLSILGNFLLNTSKFFNSHFGNFIFSLLFKMSKPLLRKLIAFPSDQISDLNIKMSIKNFEKIKDTIKSINKTIQ